MTYHGKYGPVGYIFNADQYCESCICGLVRKRYNLKPGTGQARKGCNCTECVLERLAKVAGVADYYDERSYDSGDFPKSIPYHNDLHCECGPEGYGYGPGDPEWNRQYCKAVCGQCHEVIDGTSIRTDSGGYADVCPAYDQRREVTA